MARALALRGDQMTFWTGACQGRNGECTITTAWQREWERYSCVLMEERCYLSLTGKWYQSIQRREGMERGYGWRDAERVLIPGKGSKLLHETYRNNDGCRNSSNDLDVNSCIISPNLCSMSRYESSVVSEVDMMVSPLNGECYWPELGNSWERVKPSPTPPKHRETETTLMNQKQVF